MARKKTRKRPTKRSASPRSRYSDEILGLLLLAGTVFLAVSLYSYDTNDGDLFIHLANGPPANLGGRVGATFAALAIQLMGIGAYLSVVVMGAVANVQLRRIPVPAVATKLTGIVALLMFGCILAEYAIGDITIGGQSTAAGGLLGRWGGARLEAAFGTAGAPLLALTASLLAFVGLTKLSIAWIAQWVVQTMGASFRHTRMLTARWREQRRKNKQRATVIRKYSAKDPEPLIEESEDQGSAQESNLFLTVKVPIKTRRLGAPVPETDEEIAQLPPIELTPQADPAPLPFEQPAGPYGSYALPSVDLLQNADASQLIDQKELMAKAKAITSKAAEFRVTGDVVAIHPGPVVTTFEFRPGTGVKYSRITNLEDDLSLALRAESIRIARLPGKATVGIEVPNNERSTIGFRDILASNEFNSSASKLTLALGKQIHGENIVTDLARMPHLLIAGTTGSGKSVALNCMLLSLLYKATPEEVKVVLIDPKRLEFGLYTDIPHLLTPVVVDPKLAANALSWAVREMERRYRLLADYGVRNIDQFNLILKRSGEELADIDGKDLKPLPYIVVIIDELADLMMTASNVVEEAIIRLSQMARAVGIHLILATQRPSVDVLTGVIKNNLPARMSFRVASRVDSRVILDTQGAETLLGRGDMLFLAPGTSRLSRVHGAFVTEDEVKAVIEFWRDQARPRFQDDVLKAPPDAGKFGKSGRRNLNRDEFFDQAVRLVVTAGEASVSNIQRKLGLGYARAGRIMDMMEAEGIVGPPRGSKPRKILRNGITATAQ